jgi:hypothetical protein
VPDANGNLVPGDPTPTTCKRVGLIVPVLLKDDGGTIAKSNAHPEFQGRPLTADFILGDYRTALNEGGLDLCDTDEIAAGKPLRLSVVKFESHPPGATRRTTPGNRPSRSPPSRSSRAATSSGRSASTPATRRPPTRRSAGSTRPGTRPGGWCRRCRPRGEPFAFSIVLAGSVAANGDCTGLPNSYFGSRVKSTIPPPPGGMNQAAVQYYLQLSSDGTTWNPFTDLLLSLPFPPRNCALGTGPDPCPDHGPGSPWKHF